VLEHFFPNQLTRGLIECLIAGLTALIVMLAARRRRARAYKRSAAGRTASVLQIVAVGAILSFLLHGPALDFHLRVSRHGDRSRQHRAQARKADSTSIHAGVDSHFRRRRLHSLPDGTARSDPAQQLPILLPVGSMVHRQHHEHTVHLSGRLRGEVTAHVGEIESALALGATADHALSPYLNAAFRASLIPSVDNIRSLGIVWIPGIMAGMVLSGSSPLYAALYQFVVLTTIFSASAIACLVASNMVTRRLFSSYDQLLLRP